MIVITDHAAERLAERGITCAEARRVVQHGRPIEQRGNALRINAAGITVVVSITRDAREAVVVTAWRDA
jgi:hypothetical protein